MSDEKGDGNREAKRKVISKALPNVPEINQEKSKVLHTTLPVRRELNHCLPEQCALRYRAKRKTMTFIKEDMQA